MKLPQFTAEAALTRTMTGYRNTAAGAMRSDGVGVIASLKGMMKAGCGACSELKWPNGTGTGACVQDCCDLSGNCKFQACPCGGSGTSVTRSFGAGSFLAR
jgi:hypothetical protein